MNIFGVGLPEIAVIAALALVIFGPKKLPELGRNLGKTLKTLQKASSEFESEFQKAVTNTDDVGNEAPPELKTQVDSPEQNKKI